MAATLVGVSAFGEWTTAEGLPAFAYRAGPTSWDPIIDPPSTRHRVHVGNRRITLVADSDGLCSVWDEHVGCWWIAEHTGISRLGELSTDAAEVKLFGPTFFRVSVGEVERTVLCPEGDVPWVLIKVDVVNRGAEVLRGALTEEWVVRPRLVNLAFGPAQDDTRSQSDGPVVALEEFGGDRVETTAGPLLVSVPVELPPGQRKTVWFRFGPADRLAAGQVGPEDSADPAVVYTESLAALRNRLPTAAADRAPEAAREIP